MSLSNDIVAKFPCAILQSPVRCSIIFHVILSVIEMLLIRHVHLSGELIVYNLVWIQWI